MANKRRDKHDRRRSGRANRRERGREPQESPWWRSWQSLAIALAALGLVGVFVVGLLQNRGGPAEIQVSDAPVPPELLETGAQLYASSCAACHGTGGEGFATPGIAAPPLNGSAHSWHHPDQQIVGWIRQGGTQMPAVGATWSGDQIRGVMAYMKQWWAPWQQESQQGDIGEVLQ